MTPSDLMQNRPFREKCVARLSGCFFAPAIRQCAHFQAHPLGVQFYRAACEDERVTGAKRLRYRPSRKVGCRWQTHPYL